MKTKAHKKLFLVYKGSTPKKEKFKKFKVPKILSSGQKKHYRQLKIMIALLSLHSNKVTWKRMSKFSISI